MAYVTGNPRTKKALKELVATGRARAFAPGIGDVPDNGTVFLEGPHYPAPHTWYAQATVKDGVIVKVK